MKNLSKGGGGSSTNNFLLTADGDRLTRPDGDFLYGEGIKVPTSIHEYMPFRQGDLTAPVAIDHESATLDDPENWPTLHQIITDLITSGTYMINIEYIIETTFNNLGFGLAVKVDGDLRPGVMYMADVEDSEHDGVAFAHIHAPGALTIELVVAKNAGQAAQLAQSTILIKRVD